MKDLVASWNGKPLAVFGLGISGLSVIRAVSAAGGQCYAWDDNKESHDAAKKAGAEVRALNKTALKKCVALVLAPGVPLHHPEPHPVVKAARDAGIEIIGDIELFHRLDHGRKVIALTGTNGKSTTTNLIQHVLSEAGYKSVLGGNVGTPVFDLKLPSKKDGVIVLELSSFQLDLCQDFAADTAILLNITPDHIDRHGSVEDYAAAKERIFQGAEHAVICTDDDYTQQIYERLNNEGRQCIPVSITEDLEHGIFVSENAVVHDTLGQEDREVGALNGIVTLHGRHNHQNAAVAYAALKCIGLESDNVLEFMQSYAGLPHRQFPVRLINGVSYINDSKATNAQAAEKALTSYQNIYWIVGGRAKDGALNGLERYAENVAHAFLIGESMDEFAQWMDQYGIEYNKSKTLDIALDHAHTMAQDARGRPGGSGCVLLSPACASYDQFKSFEERGDCFTKLVNGLEEDSEDQKEA